MRTLLAAVAIASISASAGASEWSASCTKDGMTDVITCQVVNHQVAIMVFFEGAKRSPTYVCIYANDFPGRQGAIRVDQNKALNTDDNGCVSARAILTQMKKGSTIRSRAYEWPDDFPKDRQGSLSGFAAAIGELKTVPVTLK